jgi:hypothetical protein
MKLISLNADGQAIAEDCPAGKRQVEVIGNHVLSPSAIWRHRGHRHPSIAIVWQGRIICEGGPGEEDPQPEEPTGAFFLEQSIIKDHKGSLGVSRRWVRGLIAALVLFGKTAIMVMGGVGIGLILYVFLWVMPNA